MSCTAPPASGDTLAGSTVVRLQRVPSWRQSSIRPPPTRLATTSSRPSRSKSATRHAVCCPLPVGGGIAPLVELVVPHLCEACGELLTGPGALCEACRGTLAPDPFPPGGRDPGGEGDLRILAAARYEGEVAHRIMQRFKYGGARALARPLGRAMAGALGAAGLVPGPDGSDAEGGDPGPARVRLVPVPASPERRRLRGYDQARLLADEVGRCLGWPVEELLRRRPGVSSQTRLGVRERARNLTGVFAARPRTPYCPVVLIDDVWTTGATLSACQRALEEAGHPVVAGLVAFRTPRRRPPSAGAATSPSRGHPREKGHVS